LVLFEHKDVFNLSHLVSLSFVNLQGLQLGMIMMTLRLIKKLLALRFDDSYLPHVSDRLLAT